MKTGYRRQGAVRKLLCAVVVAALAVQSYADVSRQTRQLQQQEEHYSSTVQVIDEEGNYVGDIATDYEPIQGHPLASEELAGALHEEVLAAEAAGGKCRRFHARAIPMFDSPSGVSDVVSSVMVPVQGKIISASVQLNLTHEKAGSAGVQVSNTAFLHPPSPSIPPPSPARDQEHVGREPQMMEK